MKKERSRPYSTNFPYVRQIAALPHRQQNEVLVTLQAFLSAKILLSLLPYLPKEFQSVRALEKITGVSHGLISSWINEFGSLYVKGGDSQ